MDTKLNGTPYTQELSYYCLDRGSYAFSVACSPQRTIGHQIRHVLLRRRGAFAGRIGEEALRLRAEARRRIEMRGSSRKGVKGWQGVIEDEGQVLWRCPHVHRTDQNASHCAWSSMRRHEHDIDERDAAVLKAVEAGEIDEIEASRRFVERI